MSLPWLEPLIQQVECRCKRCCPSHSPLVGTGCCCDSGCHEELQLTGYGIWDQLHPEIEPWQRWGAWCHLPLWGSQLAHPPPPEQLQPTQSYFWPFSLSFSLSKSFTAVAPAAPLSQNSAKIDHTLITYINVTTLKNVLHTNIKKHLSEQEFCDREKTLNRKYSSFYTMI